MMTCDVFGTVESAAGFFGGLIGFGASDDGSTGVGIWVGAAPRTGAAAPGSGGRAHPVTAGAPTGPQLAHPVETGTE